MMELLLATAAVAEEAAEHQGFGLNFDILETNLINIAIIVGVLVYFGRGLLGKTLGDRRAAIETAIGEAETRKKTAAAALADQQQKLAQAQAEAGRIRTAAEESAKVARAEILAQAEREIVRIQAEGQTGIEADQERIMTELRQRIAAMAVQQVESRLRSDLNENSQQQLIDRSLTMLGENG